MRARQTHHNTSPSVLIGKHNVEVFCARPSDGSVLYFDVISLECAAYTANCCLAAPTPPVFSYYSNLVLRPYGAHLHLIQMVAHTEFAVCAVVRFLLATGDGVLSLVGINCSLQVNVPVMLPVLVEVRQNVDQVHFLEIIRNSKFNAAVGMMEWKTIATKN